MLESERPEFDSILASLFGALDKPLTDAKREGFWQSLSKMSLMDFGRCRDLLLRDLETNTPKTFGAGDVWDAKRRLRARAPYQHEKPDDGGWTGDGWDLAANRHLLAHIRDQAARGVHYASLAVCTGIISVKVSDDETRRMTSVLVSHKNAWAADMRDEDKPDIATQKRHWKLTMERAEKIIREVP